MTKILAKVDDVWIHKVNGTSVKIIPLASADHVYDVRFRKVDCNGNSLGVDTVLSNRIFYSTYEPKNKSHQTKNKIALDYTIMDVLEAKNEGYQEARIINERCAELDREEAFKAEYDKGFTAGYNIGHGKGMLFKDRTLDTAKEPESVMSLNSRKHSHYFKDVTNLTEIDVYVVCALFGVSDMSGATHHAVKKLLLSGKRGVKSPLKDIKEARDTLNRLIEIEGLNLLGSE